MSSKEIKVIKVTGEEDLQKVFAIRKEVFVVEQNCPPELEWEHEEESVHFLAVCDRVPCGAARWRKTDKGYKLERFAVLKPYRGLGVGEHLVKAVLSDLPDDAKHIYLNAQVTAIDFYKRLGFEVMGELFEEAGIMHRQMILSGE